MAKADDTEANKDKFGKYNTDYNWYDGAIDFALWNGGSSKGLKDPCPTGWRVPTKSEFDKLMGGDGTGTSSLGNSGWDSTNKGYWFNGTSSPVAGSGLFLAAAGYRNMSGMADARGNFGSYWALSTATLYIDNNKAKHDSDFSAIGNSVRCVQE